MYNLDFPVGMVLYTDGGERRCSGYGVHGYIYDSEKPLEKNPKKTDVPTSIGYLNQEDLKTQTLKLVKPTHYVDTIAGLPSGVSNNAAELSAAICGIDIANTAKAKELTILTDSKLVVQGITEWLPKWQNNNWLNSQGQPVANKELWEKLNANVTEFKTAGGNVQFRWVKGHSGNLGNETADIHATFGIVAANKGNFQLSTTISPAAKYWAPESDHNRLIGTGKMYFQTNVDLEKTKDGRFVYFCGDHGDDGDTIGKRVPDAAHSVLYLATPDPVLEMIRNYQNQVQSHQGSDVVVAHLGNILSSGNYSRLKEQGDTYLNHHPLHGDIYLPASNAPKVANSQHFEKDFVSGYRLTEVRKPPLLAMRAINHLNSLQAILDDFIEKGVESTQVDVTDITAHLYETETSKKGEVCKLLKSVGTSVKAIKVPVNYRIADAKKQVDVVLTLGIDLPVRNTLNALSESKPKVYVLTYPESPISFRYVTVVDTGRDIGIFSSVHSNLKVLKDT